MKQTSNLTVHSYLLLLAALLSLSLAHKPAHYLETKADLI